MYMDPRSVGAVQEHRAEQMHRAARRPRRPEAHEPVWRRIADWWPSQRVIGVRPRRA